MASSIIDILIRANVQGAINNINRLGGAVKAFVAGAVFKSVVDNIVEAQNAAAQLDAAFKTVSKTVGITRGALDDLATGLQNTTTFGDDLVKQAEAVLLTFNKVRGEGFERTIKAAADLSTRFGGDLVSTTKLLGKALQDPIRGLTQLRRAGVSFTDSQKTTIESFVQGGQSAKAQALILAEVEKRFNGAAAAARNTLGGALAGLTNAFGDLFEGTEKGTSSSVKAINALSKTLQDPKIKENIDNLIAAISLLISKILELAAVGAKVFANLGLAIGDTVAKLMGELTVNEEINKLLKERVELQRLVAQGRKDNLLQALIKNKGGSFADPFRDEIKAKGIKPSEERAFFEQKLRINQASIDRLRSTFRNRTGVDPVQPSATEEVPKDTGVDGDAEGADNRLTEVIVANRKKIEEANDAVTRELEEKTRTQQERDIANFEEKKRALIELRELGKRGEAGGISAEVFNKRLGEAQDELLPEIDLGKIRSQFKVIETQASQTAEIIRGAFRQAGASIQSTLSDAIQTGKLSFRSLVDVARKAIADIVAALIVSKISGFLGAALGLGGGGDPGVGGGSSFAPKKDNGTLAGVLGAIFGARAGGGQLSAGRSAIVGEDGPEVITATSGGGVKVFNRRQLMGAGGGANVFAPSTNIQIIERENPEQTKQELLRIVAIQNSKNEERFMQRLAKNGVQVR